MNNEAKQCVDRSAISIGRLEDDSDEIEYWHARTPEERIEALELMRQTVYGYGETPPRLQRVLEVTEFEAR
jgi:hypothetical protein